MQKPKPTTVYRSLLADALRAAWERKALWVFGLFAALLSTGGAWEMMAKSAYRLSTLRDTCVQIARGTFAGTELFGRAVRDVLALDPSRVTGLLTLVTVAMALAVAVSVVSQGALVAGTGTKRITDAEAVRLGRRSFWDLLALNLLHKCAHALITLLAAVPLLALLSRPTEPDVLAAFLMFLAVFPLTIIVSTLFMLASVDAVKNGSHAFDAIHHAVRVWRAHWLAALELGLLLFLVAALAGVLFILALALLAVPFAVMVTVALALGSTFSFLVANVFGALVFVVLLVAFAGILTSFQYGAWVRFHGLATGKKRVVSKVHRVWIGR